MGGILINGKWKEKGGNCLDRRSIILYTFVKVSLKLFHCAKLTRDFIHFLRVITFFFEKRKNLELKMGFEKSILKIKFRKLVVSHWFAV